MSRIEDGLTRVSRTVARVRRFVRGAEGEEDVETPVLPVVGPDNLNTGFASREVPNYVRNARFIYGWIICAALFFGCLELGAFVAFRDIPTLVIGVVLMVFATGVFQARRLVIQRRPTDAVKVFSVFTFAGAACVSLVKPDLVATLNFAPVLAVAMAIPLASSRNWALILLGAWLSVVAINLTVELALLRENLPEWGLPEYWASGFRVAAAATAGGVIFGTFMLHNLGFWHYRFESSYDGLTRLPNRAFFLEQLRERTAQSTQDEGNGFHVLFMELEDYDVLTEGLGEDMSDTLLFQVGQRLTLHLYGADTVARVGARRFGIMLDCSSRRVDPGEEAVRLADVVEASLRVGGVTRHLQSVFVIVEDPKEFGQISDLESAVEVALDTAKRQTLAYINVNDTDVHTVEANHRLVSDHLARSVQSSSDNEGISEVQYQPVVGLASGDIVGFEASAFWEHPSKGPSLIQDYLPYVANEDAISRITYQTVMQAVSQVSQWRRRYREAEGVDRPISLYVRMSAAQLSVGGFAEQIGEILNTNGVYGEDLVIETSEDEVFKDPRTVADILMRLRRKYGVRICLTNFGIGGEGRTSLSTLGDLSPDMVKMHPALARGFGEKKIEREEILARCIVFSVHLHGADVVADGVSAEDQLRELREEGFDYALGRLFANPLSADTATAFLDERIGWR